MKPSAPDPLADALGPLAEPPVDLDAAERRAAAVEAALADATRRIDAAIVTAGQPPSRGEVFAMASADALLVSDLRQAQVGSRGVVDGLMSVATDVGSRLEGLLDAVRFAARIETRRGARIAAVSAIGWGGDSASVLDGGLDAAHLERHLRAIRVSLRARQVRVRFVGVVLGGAARVAAAFGGGGLRALPAIYRFVEQVLDAYDTLAAAESAALPAGAES